VRQAAIESLAGSRPGSVWLFEAHQNPSLPESLRPEVARLLRSSPFPDLRNRALIAFPAPGRLNPKDLPSLALLAQRKGDPARGKRLLTASLTSDLQCLKCHTVRGVGGHVGPDLSVIGKKASRENLLESILYPSRAIADQFIVWQIETQAGLAQTGLIVEETADQILLRDATGKDSHIRKADILRRNKSPNSIMPADLAGFMTEEELVDLTEYLFSLKSPALAMDYWYCAGPLPRTFGSMIEATVRRETELNSDNHFRGKASDLPWRKVRPNDVGFVDMRGIPGQNGDQAVCYLFREIESPVDQDATIFLGTEDTAQLWFNGQPVSSNQPRPAAAPEADALPIKLRRGRNQILLKLFEGGGLHGFYFVLQSVQELKRVESK
jgi:putative heme-binding domain-containing protein